MAIPWQAFMRQGVQGQLQRRQNIPSIGKWGSVNEAMRYGTPQEKAEAFQWNQRITGRNLNERLERESYFDVDPGGEVLNLTRRDAAWGGIPLNRLNVGDASRYPIQGHPESGQSIWQPEHGGWVRKSDWEKNLQAQQDAINAEDARNQGDLNLIFDKDQQKMQQQISGNMQQNLSSAGLGMTDTTNMQQAQQSGNVGRSAVTETAGKPVGYANPYYQKYYKTQLNPWKYFA